MNQFPTTSLCERTKTDHHNIFNMFICWQGFIEKGWHRDFIGALTRNSFSSFFKHFNDQPEPLNYMVSEYPDFDENYFDWIDVLESVVSAKKKFTMIELGGGYGRWLIRAGIALRKVNDIPFSLIGVEAEPEHFEWMKLHFTDNGIDPANHQLIEAAVADRDGSVMFHIGQAYDSYGQAIASDGSTPSSTVKEVRAVSLNTLLRPLDRVDLIDLDVQGAELMVLRAAAKELDHKVKRVHIGTHNFAVEAGLRDLFTKLGWRCLNDYGCGSQSQTPYGLFSFQDGIQTWVNPRFCDNQDKIGLTESEIDDYVSTPLSDFLNSLGESEFLEGNKDNAKSIFTHIIDQWPSYYLAYNNLAVVLWEAGNIQDALHLTLNAFKIAPYDRNTVLNCGKLLIAIGKLEDAKRLYAAYLREMPDDELSCILSKL